MPALTLYGIPLSGHSHRVELFLHLLRLDYEYIEAQKDFRDSPAYRALNPLGQIPVLKDGDLVLADSNAILVYLAKRYDAGDSWLPQDPVAAARVQRWLSIAAGEIMHGPAAARVMTLFGAASEPARTAAMALAGRVLTFMEAHLKDRSWLAAEAPTLADVACYTYVAHAPEGGVTLSPYPALRAWLARVEALPRFKGLVASRPGDRLTP
ncbi:glutathione S-transferase [Phenylobacterium sp.]|uniref:glutathione S-transferase family protein n=1 Tax=Phenylobacterium sp. TaxID=1871053 RepID=UPI00286DAEB2|nr:glutathione S-transferase [Phenylobacterium sp.]